MIEEVPLSLLSDEFVVLQLREIAEALRSTAAMPRAAELVSEAARRIWSRESERG